MMKLHPRNELIIGVVRKTIEHPEAKKATEKVEYDPANREELVAVIGRIFSGIDLKTPREKAALLVVEVTAVPPADDSIENLRTEIIELKEGRQSDHTPAIVRQLERRLARAEADAVNVGDRFLLKDRHRIVELPSVYDDERTVGFSAAMILAKVTED